MVLTSKVHKDIGAKEDQESEVEDVPNVREVGRPVVNFHVEQLHEDEIEQEEHQREDAAWRVVIVCMEHDCQKIGKKDETLRLHNPSKFSPLVVDDQLKCLGCEHRNIFHIAQSNMEVERICGSNFEIVLEVNLLENGRQLIGNLEVWIDSSPFDNFLQVGMEIEIILGVEQEGRRVFDRAELGNGLVINDVEGCIKEIFKVLRRKLDDLTDLVR